MQRSGAKTRAGVAAMALVLLGACTAQYQTHGYMPPEEDLQQIVPGVDTRASVEDLVGVPTTSGVTRDSGFYYIETEMKRFAWQAPEVVDRRVLAITFGEGEVVDNIVTYGLEDGRVVPIQKRVTVSGDGEIGFIRRLFGNIGGLSLDNLLDN